MTSMWMVQDDEGKFLTRPDKLNYEFTSDREGVAFTQSGAQAMSGVVGGLVKAAAMGELPDEPRLYYLVRYYPKAAQHDYYLVRQGNTRVELPGYRGPDAQWTWDECERVDPKHRYKRVLVEE